MDAVCTIKNTSDPLTGDSKVTKHEPLDNYSKVYIKLSQFWETMRALIFFPYELARFQEQAASHEVNLWEKDTNAPNEEYYMNFTKPFPVAAIKSAQAKYSVGFQTLLFSAVSSALERTLKDCQQLVTENVLADCSRPVIPHPEGLTNSFYFGHICAPLFSSSKEVRLLETERSFRAHRVSNISMGLYYVMEMAAVLPSRLPWMCYSYLFQFVHIIFTSFPYYSTGVLLNNVPVSDSFTFFASPHRSADFITLVTGTASQIRFGLSIRKNVISLPPRFVHIIGEYIEEEMEQLCTLKNGRIAPANTMTVLTADGYMDVTEFPNLFDKRVLQKRDRNGNPVFGKFCETITHFLGYPFFIKVKNFDLAKHIVAFDYYCRCRIAPVNAMTVLTVDGYMDLAEFQNLFDKRILQKRDRNGNPVFGKFCETITHFLGYPFFIKVKNFDLAKHIVDFDYHLEGIDCFDENHLKVYLSNLMNEPWVDGTSYWKVTLIHNYNDQAKTLIIMKWQHVLADGFAMRSVMDAVCSIENTLDPVIGGSNLTKHKSLDIKSMVSL
ncbi:unnamed protein product, partial [Allacma fusca]